MNQRTENRIEKHKAKTQCSRCGEWVHWWSDHEEDGSLKEGVKSNDKQPYSSNNNPEDRKSGEVVFDICKLIPSHTTELVDDGAG